MEKTDYSRFSKLKGFLKDLSLDPEEIDTRITSFLREFASIYYVEYNDRNEMFDTAFKTALKNSGHFNYDKIILQYGSIVKPDFKTGIRNAARSFIEFKLKKPDPSYQDVIFDLVFGSIEKIDHPLIHVSNRYGKHHAAFEAFEYFSKYMNRCNTRRFDLGFTCGSTVLRFIISFLNRVELDPIFRKLLLGKKFNIWELTNKSYETDMLILRDNPLIFYEALKEHGIIKSESCYHHWSADRQALEQVNYLFAGIGTVTRSKIFHNTEHSIPGAWRFEINGIPFYNDGTRWITTLAPSGHIENFAAIHEFDNAEQIYIIASGAGKKEALIDLLKADQFFRKQGKRIVDHLFLDLELYHAIAAKTVH